MNPLMVFFILSLFIVDIIYNEKRLFIINILFVISYWIGNFFLQNSRYHDNNRNLQLASYSQSYDPSIYARIKLNLINVKKFIEEQFAINGKNITYTLFFVKVFAEVLKLVPEANIAIRFGKVKKIYKLGN